MPTGGSSDPADSVGSSGDETGSAGDTEGSNGGDDIKFDLPGNGDAPTDPGCKKVDFLFVIDNSGSMLDEQQNLVASFPGFISAIESTLDVDDFHVMVVDSDEGGSGGGSQCANGDCTCGGDNCCQSICASHPDYTCNGNPCLPPPPEDTCAAVLGAGRVRKGSDGSPCDIAGDDRYLVQTQPDLPDAFSCIAEVGIEGAGSERMMDAMLAALGSTQDPGACNEGFLREDAILVVTYISDEEDDAESAGNPQGWKQAVIDAKSGDESAVVVLGLVGDTDLPGAVCQPLMVTTGAEGAPRLRAFAESFANGSWASVCEPDYAPFFQDAVAVIDSACEDFEPPG